MNIFAENAILNHCIWNQPNKNVCFCHWNDGEMFCYFAVMGTVMEDEQKNSVKLSYWIHEQYKREKRLNVFQQRKKKDRKIMENDMILTDLEQDKIVPFKHKVHPS